MAVVSVNQTSVREAEQLEDNVRRYVVNYVVVTDSLLDTEYSVMSSPLIPARGATYPVLDALGQYVDPFAKVWQRRVKSRSGTKHVWDVEVEYYTLSTTRPETTIIESPFEQPVQYEYRTMHTTRVLIRDSGLNPYVNSAGQVYDAADLTVPHSTSAMIVTFNRPFFSASIADNYTLAVNDRDFLAFGESYPERTVLVWDISATPGLELNGWSYARITIEFHFNEETWDLKLLDAGHRRFSTPQERAASEVFPPPLFALFKDVGGNLDPIPRLLDGTGYELPTGGQVQYKTFQHYKLRDLNQLEHDL